MPLDANIVAEARAQYLREHDRYLKLARYVAAICGELVEESGIQATVQQRAKEPGSFERKLTKYLEEGNVEKIEAIGSAADALEVIGDLAAVRVATYVEADRGRVVELIQERFDGPGAGAEVVVEVKHKDNGYRATHCQVLLPSDMHATPDTANIRSTSAEIQVCSMLAHVWNEIEHDMRYKFNLSWGEDKGFLDQTLASFREETERGDADIEILLGLRSEKVAASLEPHVSERFVTVSHFVDNAGSVLRELVRLGYTTVARLDETLLVGDYVASGRELIGRINVAFDVAKVEHELRLDANNADVLLALLIQRHCADLTALYSRKLENGGALRAALVAQAVRDTQALV